MRRNIRFAILASVILACLFGLAATCNLCGIEFDTADSNAENKTDVSSANMPDINENSMQSGSQTSEESGENIKEEAPAIKLEIFEGPFYSAAEDVCYWRVKAIATGAPAPKITWSADYSNGSYGKDIAQINLTRDEPDYILTATATNSAGTASDEIYLSWGCDAEESEEPQDTEESLPMAELIETHEIILYPDTGLSGNIRQGQAFFTEGLFSAGDSNNNKQIKSYISFNLTGSSGVSILNARLDLKVRYINGQPGTISNRLIIMSCNYGSSLDLADFDIAGTNIQVLDISDAAVDDVLSISGNNALLSTLRDAINENRTWYQIQVFLGGATNNNGISDSLSFTTETVSLSVTYSS